jgi:threonine synthase
MIYYVASWASLPPALAYGGVTFVVPSGNFGNLTAGMIAAKMGLPNVGFMAATNANDVVPQFLDGG